MRKHLNVHQILEEFQKVCKDNSDSGELTSNSDDELDWEIIAVINLLMKLFFEMKLKLS